MNDRDVVGTGWPPMPLQKKKEWTGEANVAEWRDERRSASHAPTSSCDRRPEQKRFVEGMGETVPAGSGWRGGWYS